MFHFMQMHAIALMFLQQQPKQQPTDMRGQSGCQQSKKKKRNHERALMCIQSDYLQPDSLIGSEFHLMYSSWLLHINSSWSLLLLNGNNRQ
jgi:hypothetical protein